MTSIRILLLPLLLLGLSGEAPLLAQGAAPPRRAGPAAPVTIAGAVLFRVRGTSSFPATERAASIHQRIVAAAADPAVTLISVSSGDRDGVVRLVAGERLLMTVVDADGAVEDLSRNELGTAHL